MSIVGVGTLDTYRNLKTHNELGQANIDLDIVGGRAARPSHVYIDIKLAERGAGGPYFPDTARSSRCNEVNEHIKHTGALIGCTTPPWEGLRRER